MAGWMLYLGRLRTQRTAECWQCQHRFCRGAWAEWMLLQIALKEFAGWDLRNTEETMTGMSTCHLPRIFSFFSFKARISRHLFSSSLAVVSLFGKLLHDGVSRHHEHCKAQL